MDVDMANSHADDSFEAQSQAFLAWAQQHGIEVSPKIKIVDYRSDHRGRAVAAVDNIDEDEDLFSIPRTAILTPQTSSLPSELVSELNDPWLSLILTMIYEHQQSSSPWQAYLDLLPDHFDSLMFWSDSELKQLQGSAVLNKIGKAKANETFKSRIIPVVRQHEDVFNTAGQSEDQLLSLCHRMASIIMAYAFDLEDPNKEEKQKDDEDGWEEDSEDGKPLPVGMVPFADLLNADADRNNAKLYYEEGKVVMRSIKSIGKGEEIFNDYGLIPTADLARRYGYVTDNYAKYDVVEIDQERLSSVALEVFKLSQDQLSHRLDYLGSEMPVDAFDIARLDAEDGQLPIELLGVLRCLAMSQADFDKLESKGKMPSDKPLAQDERSVLEALQAIINHRIGQYTSITDDSSSYRQHMAFKIISGEKLVLTEAFNTIKQMLDTQHKPTEAAQQHKRVKK